MDNLSSQGTIDEEISESLPKASVEPKATRTKDPMAFSSILSSTEPDAPVSLPHPTPASKHIKTSSHVPNGDAKPPTAPSRKSASKAVSSPKDYPGQSSRQVKAEFEPPTLAKNMGSNKTKPGVTSDKENEKVKKEMARIDAMDMSDFDSPEYEVLKQRHVQSSLKRQHAVEAIEESKRKVRPTGTASQSSYLSNQYFPAPSYRGNQKPIVTARCTCR